MHMTALTPTGQPSMLGGGLLLSVAAILFATAAQAGDAGEYGIEITPIAGYRSGGSFEDATTQETLELDESESYGLIINIDDNTNINANTQWELTYSHQDTELQLGPTFTGNRLFDLNVDYFSVGGVYIWEEEHLQPFVGVTVGATYLDPQDSTYDSESYFLMQIGGGFKYFLTRNIGLRIEARGYGTFLDTDAEVFCSNGACIARVESSGFGQAEVNAGLNLRF